METPFHEQDLYARHTLFVGGRYVQVRFAIAHPQDFEAADPDAKNGQLDSKEAGIQKSGLKLNVFVKELPDGNPELVEQEGWKGGDEFLLGTATFKAQERNTHEGAQRFFANYAHVPGRQNMLFRGVGVIGRHRSPIYLKSESLRRMNQRGS